MRLCLMRTDKQTNKQTNKQTHTCKHNIFTSPLRIRLQWLIHVRHRDKTLVLTEAQPSASSTTSYLQYVRNFCRKADPATAIARVREVRVTVSDPNGMEQWVQQLRIRAGLAAPLLHWLVIVNPNSGKSRWVVVMIITINLTITIIILWVQSIIVKRKKSHPARTVLAIMVFLLQFWFFSFATPCYSFIISPPIRWLVWSFFPFEEQELFQESDDKINHRSCWVKNLRLNVGWCLICACLFNYLFGLFICDGLIFCLIILCIWWTLLFWHLLYESLEAIPLGAERNPF